ncbi:hypothetical protein EZV62_001072 [Acer yangbiense]|uniref:CCHC-type domain-containing protein n=1 Tax=Acer yangbiense TaxID=1000413 RepID=A0A5C7ISU8_9ROSI|nr:hypothetical protein EZV62_001072 [Acer yangbiense]
MDQEEIARLCAALSIKSKDEKLWSVQDTLKESAGRKLDLCLVGKILSNKHVNRDVFRTVIPKIWQIQMEIEVVQDNTFLFYFRSQSDRCRVLAGGPWSFDNSLLVLEKVSGVGDIANVSFNRVEFWIQIMNAHLLCMTKEMGIFLGKILGDLVDIDVGVTGECFGKYMRLKVVIDVSKPLQRFLRLDLQGNGMESLLLLRYEKLPEYCFNCGLLGHSYQVCIHDNAGGDKRAYTDFEFGPWMRASSPPGQNRGNGLHRSHGGVWNTKDKNRLNSKLGNLEQHSNSSSWIPRKAGEVEQSQSSLDRQIPKMEVDRQTLGVEGVDKGTLREVQVSGNVVADVDTSSKLGSRPKIILQAVEVTKGGTTVGKLVGTISGGGVAGIQLGSDGQMGLFKGLEKKVGDPKLVGRSVIRDDSIDEGGQSTGCIGAGDGVVQKKGKWKRWAHKGGLRVKGPVDDVHGEKKRINSVVDIGEQSDLKKLKGDVAFGQDWKGVVDSNKMIGMVKRMSTCAEKLHRWNRLNVNALKERIVAKKAEMAACSNNGVAADWKKRNTLVHSNRLLPDSEVTDWATNFIQDFRDVNNNIGRVVLAQPDHPR